MTETIQYPDDYNQNDVDSRVSLRTRNVRNAIYGGDVRNAIAQGVEIGSVVADEAKDAATDAKTQSQNIDDRFNDQIAGSTNDNEVIDFRHSDMLSKSFTTAKLRGDSWDIDLQERGVNVKWFGAVADGTTDNTSAFQEAIDFAYANFSKLSDTSEDNITGFKVVIPAGVYAFASGLVVPPVVKLVASGFVKMISKITDGTPLIWVKQKDSVSSFNDSIVYKQAYTRGYILDGTQGGIMLSRDGATENNPVGGVGLAVGNETNLTTNFPVSRYSMRGVMISGFNEAIHWYGINHYMGNYYDFHVEDNNYGVVVGDTDIEIDNSNENFNFFGSLFAMCHKAAIYSKNIWDIHFYGCSFDYNEILFDSLVGSSYMTIIGGHLENNIVILKQEDTRSFNFSLIIENARIVTQPTQTLFNGYSIVKLLHNKITATVPQTVDSLYDANVAFFVEGNERDASYNNIFWNTNSSLSLNGTQVTKDPINLGTTYGISQQTNISTIGTDTKDGEEAIVLSSEGKNMSLNFKLGKIFKSYINKNSIGIYALRLRCTNSSDDFNFTFYLTGTGLNGDPISMTISNNLNLEANMNTTIIFKEQTYIRIAETFNLDYDIFPMISLATKNIDATNFKFYILKTLVDFE